LACGLVAAGALASPATAQAGHALDLPSARQAARAVVLADSTYRVIDSSQPLRTRRCWRSPGQVVHCSLYRFAGTPCALDGASSRGDVCTQVLARRIWLVEVEPGVPPASHPTSHLLRVLDTTKNDRCRTSGDDHLCS
jgi:hypothetical protein